MHFHSEELKKHLYAKHKGKLWWRIFVIAEQILRTINIPEQLQSVDTSSQWHHLDSANQIAFQ